MKIDNTNAKVTITTKGITISADKTTISATGGITITDVGEITLKRTRKGFIVEIASESVDFEKNINIA